MRDTAGSAATPAANCRKFRRGSFISNFLLHFTSFDHLVRGNEQRLRHGNAEYSCGLVIDDQFEFRRLHDWQVRRFGALDNATSIYTRLTVGVGNVGAIAHQSADFGKFSAGVNRGEPMVRCLVNELHTSTVEEAVVADKEGIGPFAANRCKRRVDFPAAAGAEELDFKSHGAGSRWRVPFYGFGVVNTDRIDKDSDARRPG